ncbi:MAG: hypothetical protein JW913_09200 [Chitinispirillaceae bacterium]|nr:hypothetical protein [Chitinispirillaceae bacterium]
MNALHNSRFPILSLSLLLLSTASCTARQKDPPRQESYSASWRIVDSLIDNGLTRSALDTTDKIYKAAKAASNSEQMVKALIYRMRLESHKEEDAFVKALNRINSELAAAPFPAAPLLQSMLAECYWHYYRNNRWRFYDRTQTVRFKLDDIHTWDLRTIMEKMTEAYRKSLQDAGKLKKVKLESFGEAIIDHWSDNKLRPTLYDFLVHRAIDYFSIDDNELTKPAFEFTLNSADYFKPFDGFAKYRIATRDTASLKFHAITLLQDLIVFHANDRSPDALIDADLKRLAFVRQRSVLENKDSLYLGALRKLERRFARNPASAEVTFHIAQLYRGWARTWTPRIDERYRWMNREALSLCEKAVTDFPDSYGGRQCKTLIDRIKAGEMDFSVESVNLPDRPFKALVSCRNMKKVYWRQVPMSFEAYRKLVGRGDDDSIAGRLRSIKPVKEWSTDLPDPGDFQRHSVEAALPALPSGHYVILCSSHPDFICEGQAIMWGATQLSRISFISRALKDGGRELHLLDRENGASLPGVTVAAWTQEYDQRDREYKNVKIGAYTSDRSGYVVIPARKKGNNCSIVCSKGNDRLDSDQRFHLYRYGQNRKSTRQQTFFFTDRAIYRPGQTVYFKGIILTTDGEKSEIAAGRRTTVTFYNVNGKEVSRLDLTGNDYGSIHGSFIAPTNTLNGRMYISNKTGSRSFSVEDYKRPKFSVSVAPFEGMKRLGDSIRVTGRAAAYAGSAIDNAQVKYRIVRRARFPDCRWCWRRPPRWSGEMEVGNGSTVTNDTGGFAVDFIARADKSIPKSEKPVFSYTLSVDVTDITGETRSTTASVSVGYVALTLNMEIPEMVNNASPPTVPLTTANCGGVFEPAAGSITIHRLAAPRTVFRNRLWDRPDTAVMTEAKHREMFPGDLFGDETDITSWKREKNVFKTDFDTKKSREFAINDIGKWQPGVYIAEGKTKDRWGNEVDDTRYFTLYAEKGKKLPRPGPDWFVPVKDKGEPGETARFLVGSGYENAVLFYEIEHKREIVKKERLKLDNGQKLIEIPIEEKHRGGFSLHVAFVRENRAYLHTAAVTVPWTNKELDISFETFRDKLTPGEKEQWKMKIAGNAKDKVAAEMVATLYDASLDAFTPHGWSFGIYPTYRAERAWGSDDGFSIHRARQCASDWNTCSPSPDRRYPELNWFGYGFDYSVGRRGAAGIGYGSGYGGGYGKDMESSIPRPAAAPRAMAKMAAAPEFTKGGSAPDIDAVLEGVGGLKAGGSGGEPRNGGTDKAAPPSDLSRIAARTNLNETAFFFPLLTTNDKGEIIVDFTIPEALTRWNMLGFAHTKDLCYGRIDTSLVTRKELMVMPNPPRFFRENDRIAFTAKVSNLSDGALDGTAQLFLFDAATMKPVDARFGNKAPRVNFSAKKGGSAPLAWNLSIPEGIGAVAFRVVAEAKNFSDGEERIIPVLTNRMLVTESVPLPIRKKETKRFTFRNLVSQNNGSKTLRNHRLTLEFTANPAWYAIQALPYLIEYPYECAEQIFSRLYANSIASHIVNSSPRIKKVFDRWRTQSPDALLSNLEKNQELKSLALEETPWLLDGKNESEAKKRVALLFDLNRMADEKERALTRLKKMQLGNGGWPWFEGMPDDRFITQYIAIGLGRLDHLGIVDIDGDATLNGMLVPALQYLDDRIREDHERIMRHGSPDEDNLSATHVQYLYMRSFFGDTEVSRDNKAAFDYFFGQAKKYCLKKSRYLQGMIALALDRSNEKTVPAKIIRSLKENALLSEETGMYWKEMYEGYSWRWYEAPIETQALMVEVFEEVARDTAAVEDLKAWLLKSKQTRNWRTTKATAEACYALLLRGTKWLEKPSNVAIRLGDVSIDPSKRDDVKAEAGTGYFKIAWSGSDITPSMGNVTVTKQEAGAAWGALYWQYFEQLDKIKPHDTPLKLEKKLFLQRQSPTGPKIAPVTDNTSLKPGDKLTVRIELRVDRDMEYVHMKDMRASGFEPLDVFSGYRWRDGLGYYESTRDAATNFFFSSVGKGTYVFEYPLVVSHAGDFSNGITTIQCMYAPEFASHSEGVRVRVGR